METLKENILSFPAKTFLRTLAAVSLVMGLTACPGGGGGGGAPPAPVPIDPYGGNCGSCASQIVNPVTLGIVQMTSSMGGVTFTNMEVVGDARYVIPNASGNNYNHYQGPIAMRGQMVVNSNQQDSWSPCQLPMGTYDVQTYEVGTMSNYPMNLVSIPRLMTTSGAIEIVLQGYFINANSFYSSIGFMRVNGNTCSQNFWDTFY